MDTPAGGKTDPPTPVTPQADPSVASRDAGVPAPAAMDERQGRDGPYPPSTTARQSGTRWTRLTASRFHLWPMLRLSFLISVGGAAALVALVAGAWLALAASGAFTAAQAAIDATLGGSSKLSLMDYLTLCGVVLSTALTTLAGLLYNICSALWWAAFSSPSWKLTAPPTSEPGSPGASSRRLGITAAHHRRRRRGDAGSEGVPRDG